MRSTKTEAHSPGHEQRAPALRLQFRPIKFSSVNKFCSVCSLFRTAWSSCNLFSLIELNLTNEDLLLQICPYFIWISRNNEASGMYNLKLSKGRIAHDCCYQHKQLQASCTFRPRNSRIIAAHKHESLRALKPILSGARSAAYCKYISVFCTHTLELNCNHDFHALKL